MERRKSSVRRKVFWIMILALLVVLCGCAANQTKDKQKDSNSVDVRKDSAQNQLGLSVAYIFKLYRNVDQIPTGEAALRMGRSGKPVTLLNHQGGKEESIFDSGRSQGVAMVMDGFLHLEKAGVYNWQALANDGIRLSINNQLMFEDPKVHKDRLTATGSFEVNKGGKIPVNIVYFQRKGTSALKLYWQPPGADQFSIVPAEVYWH